MIEVALQICLWRQLVTEGFCSMYMCTFYTVNGVGIRFVPDACFLIYKCIFLLRKRGGIAGFSLNVEAIEGETIPL